MTTYSSISSIDSNNREVFINPIKLFNRIPSTEGSPIRTSIKIVSANDDYTYGKIVDGIMINGDVAAIGKEYTLVSDNEDDHYHCIYARELSNCTIIVESSCYNDRGVRTHDNFSKIEVEAKAVTNYTSLFDKNGFAMTDTNSSFLLMRTNPKLSGNIKLVVDKDQNLFLDTFKVSDNLSKYAYRHKSVSAASSFSTDIRNIFKSLPSEDLYKVPDVDLKAHDPYTSFDMQYDTTYSYGSETNGDEMYSENFKILAPLWVDRLIPDFFVVFKIESSYNISTYVNIQDDNDIFDNFLREAKIVKAFDMRQSSPLGKYVRNHYSKISDYPGSVLMQFKEQESQDETISGINSWIGVSVDTGLVVKMDEDSYFASQTIKQGSQEKLNQFIVGGFERNRLVCPNLMNIEFMFDDDDSEPYKMNRYFGLYLKENDFIKYDYVESVINAKSKNYTIKKYDELHKEVDDRVITSQESILDNPEYDNRLFFAIGPKSVSRLKEQADLSSFLKSEIANIAYKNYQSCHSVKVESGYKNFISMKIKEQIKYGEHFRIVIPSLAAEGIQLPIVFEIIASNDRRLRDEKQRITPYISVINSENNVTDYIYYREVDVRESVDEEVFKNKPTVYPTLQAPSFAYLDKTGPIESEKDLEDLRQSYYYRAVSGQSFKEFTIRHIVKYETKFGMIDNLRGIDSEYYIAGDETDVLGTTKYPFIFRLSFYTQDDNDETKPASIETQVKRLCDCIDTFSNKYTLGLKVISSSGNALSVGTVYNEAYFQHITADILNNDYVDIVSQKIDLGREVETRRGEYELYDLKYTQEVDESKLTRDTTISYFNNDRLQIKMWPLNNQSEQFTGYSMMFAPINFELLGWRKTSVVRLIPFKEHMYEIEVEDVSKLIPNTIVNTKNGYERILDFDIASMKFLTSSMLVDKRDSTTKHYQDLLAKATRDYENMDGSLSEEEVERAYYDMMSLRSWLDDIKEVSSNSVFTRSALDIETSICVQSPYHLDKWIIASPYEISGFRSVDLYKPSEMSISLMGIMPVKDFDTEISVISKKKVFNETFIEIPPKTLISIDDNSEKWNISSGVYYTIKKGSIAGASMTEGSSFIIINNTLWYSSRGNMTSLDLSSVALVTGENGLKITAPKPKTIVSYSIDKPVMQDDKFYIDDDTSKDLAYSLVVPTVCAWSGVGMYYDQDSTLSIKGISNTGMKMSDGYMCKYQPSSKPQFKNMFLTDSLDSLIKTRDNKVMTFREYILNSSITDTINIFLSKDMKPDYTVGYYNKNINTLEFILYGVKYSITFNTNEYVREIQLSNYNKYEIYIFNHYTGEKNEMIINTLESTILIINHNFNLKKFDEKMNLFYVDDTTKAFVNNKKYSWIYTDKNVNLADAEFDESNVYLPTSENTSISPDIEGSIYFQTDFFDSSEFLYFFGSDRFINLPMPSFNGNYIKVSAASSIMSSEGDTSTVHTASTFRYNDNPVSSSVSWIIDPTYKTNQYIDSGLSEFRKYDLMRQDFLETLSEDNFIIYIKKMSGSEVNVTKIETSESYTPISVSATYPTNVKYNIDFYNPKFINMIEFDMNEKQDLISKTKTNFILSNTSFKSISRIKNYYGYKVFNNYKHRLEDKNGSMFINKEMSLVSSNWDSGFYRSYSSASRWKNIDGYLLGIEDKTFFGSKGIVLKGVEIKIEEWASSIVKVTTENIDNYSTENGDKTIGASKTFEFNMTQAFYEHFRNNAVPGFSGNWSPFANNSNAINNYIKLSLINYFKINTANAFRLYSKPSDGNDILLSMPEDFEDFSEVKNFESKYVKVNDEIILIARVTDTSKTYYATYDLKSNI